MSFVSRLGFGGTMGLIMTILLASWAGAQRGGGGDGGDGGGGRGGSRGGGDRADEVAPRTVIGDSAPGSDVVRIEGSRGKTTLRRTDDGRDRDLDDDDRHDGRDDGDRHDGDGDRHRPRPGWDDRHRHDYPFNPYYRYYSSYWGAPSVVYIEDHSDDVPAAPASTQYNVVQPGPMVWVEGHEEKVPMQDVIEGEYVDVFHPAIYERDDAGKLVLLEKERTTKEPKIRIVMTKVWIEGHWEPEQPEAGEQEPQGQGAQ